MHLGVSDSRRGHCPSHLHLLSHYFINSEALLTFLIYCFSNFNVIRTPIVKSAHSGVGPMILHFLFMSPSPLITTLPLPPLTNGCSCFPLRSGSLKMGHLFPQASTLTRGLLHPGPGTHSASSNQLPDVTDAAGPGTTFFISRS